MIELINNAFAAAEREESKLTLEAMSIGGFTSPKIRHLMNLLGAISKNYLEVGVHRGATFLATVYKNHNLETSTAIDNFSEFNQGGDIKQALLSGMQMFSERRFEGGEDLIPSWILLDQDCWTVPVPMHKPIDLYLFDGPHDYESQKKAITYFLPAMAEEFVLVIDDFAWLPVEKGTYDGIAESGLTIVEKWIKTGQEGYWNGIGVFLLRK